MIQTNFWFDFCFGVHACLGNIDFVVTFLFFETVMLKQNNSMTCAKDTPA